MLVGLFIIEILLTSIIIFATYMVTHKFKTIEASLGIYNSKRVYKTQADIAFVQGIIEKYKAYLTDSDCDVNLESMIKKALHNEYIGKFPLSSVKSIALKTSRLMWGTIVLEGAVSFFAEKTQQTVSILVITTSILLCISIEMFKFIKSIEEQNETVLVLVQDYVQNIYPMEVKKNLTNKEMIKLRTRIAELEKELKTEDAVTSAIKEYKSKEKNANNALSMQDIAKLIGIFE